jgi:phosphinothricin acetyltransferase
MKTLCDIRAAAESDLAAINDIYNHYVLHSTCTYQEEPERLDDRRRWLSHHDEQHPVIVAAIDAQVVGWASLQAFHPRSAYRYTVENSVYVHHQHLHRGIGSLLLRELIARSRALGHRVILAGIDGEQEASVALHSKFQFEKVGHLRKVGFKFGRWLDVIFMQLSLGSF